MEKQHRLTKGLLGFALFVSAFCPLTATWGQPRGRRPRRGLGPMDRNRDGVLSRSEFRGPAQVFSDMDTDGDGKVTKTEMRSFHEKRRKSGDGRSRSTVGGSYPDLVVATHDADKSWKGNVIFVDNRGKRVVEVDRTGKVVWQAALPAEIIRRSRAEGGPKGKPKGGCAAMVSDVELLPGGTMLIMAGGRGVYELNRKGEVVWSYENPAVSHDVDRLPNGDTVMACALAEALSEFPYDDPQAIAVNKQGKIVWKWQAKDEYLESMYKDVRSRDGGDWTHVNSVQRLDDGNTLVSVRNWNLLVAVDRNGMTNWMTGGDKEPHCPHTPLMLDDGTIIVSEPINGRVVIWDPKKQSTVWEWPKKTWREGGDYYFFRAAWPLPNGNIFMIDSCGQFFEVTRTGDIVWNAKKPGYQRRSHPLKLEELPTHACFFNADVRGLEPYGGR